MYVLSVIEGGIIYVEVGMYDDPFRVTNDYKSDCE